MNKILITVAVMLAGIGAVEARTPNCAESKIVPNALEQLFDASPQSRGANAWWHWQGANVTKSGITRDLEAMKDAGLSGATILIIKRVRPFCRRFTM